MGRRPLPTGRFAALGAQRAQRPPVVRELAHAPPWHSWDAAKQADRSGYQHTSLLNISGGLLGSSGAFNGGSGSSEGSGGGALAAGSGDRLWQ